MELEKCVRKRVHACVCACARVRVRVCYLSAPQSMETWGLQAEILANMLAENE